MAWTIKVGQINTVGTNGVGNVAGENSFRRLANDLKDFNPQLMKTAETADLQYVDWRVDVGEAQAMEEVQRGLAQIDEQAEVAGDRRAADNRRVSAIDPQAGWLCGRWIPINRWDMSAARSRWLASKCSWDCRVTSSRCRDQHWQALRRLRG